MRANYHTHCDRCDGKAPARVMAEAARRAGYDVLGFSSHAPMPFPWPGTLSEAGMPAYAAEIRALGREWEERGGLEVLLGLEIDWVEGLRSPKDALFDPLDLDYRIGSVHAVSIDGSRHFGVDWPRAAFDADVEEFAGGDAGRVVKAYYRCLAALIEGGGFDILGHLDLVRKNNDDGRLFDEDSPAYAAAALEAVDLLAGRDIVVEINLGGMARGKTTSPYPSLRILRELKARGVPVALAADAHAPSHLGVHLPAGRELALAAGYRSFAALTKGTWIEVPIEES